MKDTDKITLAQMAQMASAHVADERDDFFAEVDRLLAEREAKRKTLVKARPQPEN